MKLKSSKPGWANYEQQVFEQFKEYFPEATIEKNVQIRGRFSNRKRQVDILVTEKTPAGILKTVVDAKFFKRRIDVKTVDGLSGFVEDVDAQRGMLITNGGYTRAALKRAFYGPSNLELDILNFSQLAEFQGFSAIPYSGEYAFLTPAPFGWVIDATQGNGCLASMYQRGLSLKEAINKKEFLYVNFWKKTSERIALSELDQRQISRLRMSGPVVVSYPSTIQRTDAVTLLRVADVKKYKCLEITGFLEFENVIFFAVLLTTRETQRSNIRRLESVLRQAVPVELKRDNTALIAELRKQLEQSLPPHERARLLRQVGYWYRDMGQLQEAREVLEESMSLDSSKESYHTIRQLLPVLTKLAERDRAKQVMALLLRLEPENPTVFNDCFNFAAGWIERTELLKLIDALKAERPDNQIVQASCDFYAGNLLLYDDTELARSRFLSAQQTFRQIFPREHYIFGQLRGVLKRITLKRPGG